MSSKHTSSRNLPGLGESDQVYRCDICKVSFSCDLDASRHLINPIHIKNKQLFINLQGQNKTFRRQTPKNIGAVFENLKLRTPKDVKNLASKEYFEIVDPKTVEIAQKMIRVFYKRYLQFEANRRLRPTAADNFIKKMDDVDLKAQKKR